MFSFGAQFLIVVSTISLLTGTYGIQCDEPTVGKFVMGKDGTESTSLIKEKCYGMNRYATSQWRKGANVQHSCDTLPTMTAIATFTGPRQSPFIVHGLNEYKHAAIFVRCHPEGNGIVVYEQFPGQPVREHRYEYGDSYHYPVRDGSMYYTIEV